MSIHILKTKPHSHTLQMSVRDYELDMQGIVNNSIYGQYFEHARHTFLISKNIDFAKLAKEGVNLVVSKIEIDYKQALTSQDRFTVITEAMQISKIRCQFKQKIIRDHDQKTTTSALITAVATDAKSGRPIRLDMLSSLFSEQSS